jgi:hypothetical protein
MNKDFMEYLDKFTHSVHRWYIGLLQERRKTRITSLSSIAEALRPKILHQVKQMRVLDEIEPQLPMIKLLFLHHPKKTCHLVAEICLVGSDAL